MALRITPGNPNLSLGEELTFTAMALFSDGTSEDVTDRVIWSSSDPKVAVVDRTVGTVIALGVGTTTIKAIYQGLEGTVTVTVRATQPKSLLLTPRMVALEPGELFPLQAVLVFDDGSSRDVSGEANWRSNDPGVADVDGAGVVTANGPGKATVTVSYQTFSSTAMVTVSFANLQSLAVVPATLSVTAGQTLALRLIGQFDDGTSRDLTARATWISSDPGVAVVGNGSNAGVLTGVAAGTANVTATYMTRRAACAVTVP
jgi:uncharacterized protein YjdB